MGKPGQKSRLNSRGACYRCLLPLLLLLAAPCTAESLSVLSQNMNRLFDDIDDGNREQVSSGEDFRERIESAAIKFGEYYGLPQIIALQEVENLNVLTRIAREISRRYTTGYRLVLVPGQDISGINLAYMLRQDITVRRVDRFFANKRLRPDGGALFARPPLYLEACYLEKCLALLNLHLRSMRGIADTEDGPRVMRKRLQQAETVARWANRVQRSNPDVRLLLLGDLNALTPPDEFVDVAGILRGNPDNRARKLPGRDLLEPDLVDLGGLVPTDARYSYVFRGRKQQLDYMLVNRGFGADVESVAFGEIDAEFSDHAGLLARFRW